MWKSCCKTPSSVCSPVLAAMALVAPSLGSAQLTVLHLHTYTWKINVLNPKKSPHFLQRIFHLNQTFKPCVFHVFYFRGCLYAGEFLQEKSGLSNTLRLPINRRTTSCIFFALNIFSHSLPHTCSRWRCVFFGNKACSPVLSWDLQIFHVFFSPHLFAWCLVVRKNSPKNSGDVPWWNLGSMVIPSCQFYTSIWPTV